MNTNTETATPETNVENAKPKLTRFQVFRETLESLAIAFVLALLFKAFIAEAFVIPTGSMAPTLMGAHKDVKCTECGFQYQCGASNEYSETGEKQNEFVFGTVCPLCRKPQILDLSGNSNHQTFSGDRILVSKLAYALGSPQRWHVFVFKHLEDARLNYIKRCIGRPDETVRIQHGDIFIDPPAARGSKKEAINRQNADGFEIARKPPHVISSMLQPIYDSAYVAKRLVDAGVPDPWSGEAVDNGPNWVVPNWNVEGTNAIWSAKIEQAPEKGWKQLRFRHRVLDPIQWDAIVSEGKLPMPIPPDSYRLVSDFTAYNASMVFGTSSSQLPKNYSDIAPLEARRAMRLGFSRPFSRPMENDGLHWTGDLCGEWSVTTSPGTKALQFMLVEAGVEHLCRIDLSSGQATAELRFDGVPIKAFESTDGWVESITAPTPLRAGSQHVIKFANVDDSLTLWVNGTHIPWGEQGKFMIEAAIPGFQSVPRTTPENPLDAAPVAIGVQGGGCTVNRAKVFRDIYYIAHSTNQGLTDYDDILSTIRSSVTSARVDAFLGQLHRYTREQYRNTSTEDALNRNALLSDANAWGASPMARSRRRVTFPLASDAYFPMGDNSAASQDARSWYQHHVPERLLIGRAVMVFWPHYWNAPIPFLPNVQRMGLIR
jgi:signal peptidase I